MTDLPAFDELYDAEFAVSEDLRKVFADFVAIVRHLRRDCPWDRKQTHRSVRHLTLEEAYEAVEAIDREDWAALAEELGDVLLHVAFHSRIAEEDGRFSLQAVIEHETEKLVRRHPHVFGDQTIGSAEAVKKTWEKVKQEERATDDPEEAASVLDGVPDALPALLRAHRVQEKAAGVGFDFPESEGAWAKVEEELREFREAADGASAKAENNAERLEEELGDLLFAVVNYARFVSSNPENALRAATQKFTRRFHHIERRLSEIGSSPEAAGLDRMDRLWKEAKDEEGERERR